MILMMMIFTLLFCCAVGATLKELARIASAMESLEIIARNRRD